jgi:hypothetical protein
MLLAAGKICGPERELLPPYGSYTPTFMEVSMSAQGTLPALPEQDGVEFRHVVRFPGYCVGTDGSVWTCLAQVKRTGRRSGFQTVMTTSWLQMKTTAGRYGYHAVYLQRDKKMYARRVHRLVLEVFVSSCPPGTEVNHKDGNKSNNRATNLEWVTRSENCKHAYRLGLRKPTSLARENNPAAKLTRVLARKVRALSGVLSQRAIARRFGVSRNCIRLILIGETWREE